VNNYTSNRKLRKSEDGFTLIELLVVIAIIAILAAILFPVFAKVREKARQTTCLSNEKQLALVMLEYAQDYDEQFPTPFWYDGAENPSGGGTISALTGYLAQKTSDGTPVPILVCPDDTVPRVFEGNAPATYTPSIALFGTHVYVGVPAGSGNQYDLGLFQSQFPSPAGTILFAEMPYEKNVVGNVNVLAVAGPGEGTLGATTGGQLLQLASTTNPGNGQPLHSGGWNYVFVDGHAKWQRPEATVSTPGVTYPAASGCQGTIASPCGEWTTADND
jgi:prepilin-type N-terminal cleavage/methylation domain-containing protein/prepilin-type processing-associated H-X9-DG protein